MIRSVSYTHLLVDSIWKSANLEGLGTTFPKTEAILANAPTTTKTEEVLFVINMKRAWQFLLDDLDYQNSLSLLRDCLLYTSGGHESEKAHRRQRSVWFQAAVYRQKG